MPPHILCNPKPYFFFVSFWISLAFDSVQFGRSVDLLHIGNRNTQKLLWDISIYLSFFSFSSSLSSSDENIRLSILPLPLHHSAKLPNYPKKKIRKIRDEVCNWDTADVYSNKILCTTTITIIKKRILEWILANFSFCALSIVFCSLALLHRLQLCGLTAAWEWVWYECRVFANSQTNNNFEFKRLAVMCEIILFDWMTWMACYGESESIPAAHTVTRAHCTFQNGTGRRWELRAHYKTRRVHSSHGFFPSSARSTKKRFWKKKLALLRYCAVNMSACVFVAGCLFFFLFLVSIRVMWYVLDFWIWSNKNCVRVLLCYSFT